MQSAFSRMFSVPKARLGWIMIFVGVFAWFVFGRNADWKSIRFFRSQIQLANGVVTSASTTGYTMGSKTSGTDIHEVRFTFDGPDNLKSAGSSWTDYTPPKRGEKIQVEYVTSNPDIARIVNMRSGLLPLWAAGVLGFPLFGIYLIVMAIVFGHDPNDYEQ